MQDRFGRPNYFNGASCSPAATKVVRRLFRPFTWDVHDGRRRAICERIHSRAGGSHILSIVWPNDITKRHEPMRRGSRDLLAGACHIVSEGFFQQGPPTPAHSVARRAARLLSEGETEGLSLSPHQGALLFFGAPA